MQQMTRRRTMREKIIIAIAIAGTASYMIFFVVNQESERPADVTPQPASQAAAGIPGPGTPPDPIIPVPKPPKPEDERARLGEEYLTLIAGANPHLNFIERKTVKVKGGYVIWLVHPYFTQNSFSIGDDGKLVQSWLHDNGAALRRAGVVRVGLKNSSGYLGSCWFDL